MNSEPLQNFFTRLKTSKTSRIVLARPKYVSFLFFQTAKKFPQTQSPFYTNGNVSHTLNWTENRKTLLFLGSYCCCFYAPCRVRWRAALAVNKQHPSGASDLHTHSLDPHTHGSSLRLGIKSSLLLYAVYYYYISHIYFIFSSFPFLRYKEKKKSLSSLQCARTFFFYSNKKKKRYIKRKSFSCWTHSVCSCVRI